eukprot:TRINITY_DN14123_c0_g1_i1.p1 TRINITY_DN14123_c0_g1~~TRINITY_DN14123_c0_g1_i1.p1  ORF type:complete len:602 (+),score=133.93 TRINITY_DN14123_c0_g1_i1:118-1923(+)
MGRYSDRLAHLEEDSDKDDEFAGEELYVPLRLKRAAKEEALRVALDNRLAAAGVKRKHEDDGAPEATSGPNAKRSLVEINAEMEREQKTSEAGVQDERLRVEAEMLDNLLHDGRELRSAYDRAHDVKYSERMKSTWQPPEYLRSMPAAAVGLFLRKKNIVVEGADVPPPVLSFRDLRGPPALVRALESQGIVDPTPIQQQGLSVVMTGRDMIGVAYTGSGKTLVFVLPMILLCIEEESRMPLASGEGPLALSIAPSRELATQTYTILRTFVQAVQAPEIRVAQCIGGQPGRDLDIALRRGVHGVIATPGRLIDGLKKGKFNMDVCRLVCLDEADRMVDMGFEDDVKDIYQHFRHQRQTIMFSATMPRKIQQFARTSLVDPVTVNVNRAGAVSLNITQDVQYVERDQKVTRLLACLQKTEPPALIFAESKKDVDTIHEYLLLKLVDAVSIHGSRDQADRDEAMRRYRSREADVLVATDVASKGLDFPSIQHVINYDLPKEIENYVHRIGRTGRRGKSGLATTFITKDDDPTTLLDLKHLFIEAGQEVPAALQGLGGGDAGQTTGGCQYCGGLGHSVSACPKLQGINRQQQAKGASGAFLGDG